MKINRITLAVEMTRQQIGCGQLSQIAGVSRLVISKARKGKTCSYDSAAKIASALGVDLATLIKPEEVQIDEIKDDPGSV